MAKKNRIQAKVSEKTGDTIRNRLPRYHWGAFAGYLLDKYLSEDEINEYKAQWDFNYDNH